MAEMRLGRRSALPARRWRKDQDRAGHLLRRAGL